MSTKTRTKTAKPLAQLARETGVSRETIRGWRDSGIDVQDPAAIAARIAAMPGRGTDESFSDARRRREIALADRAELIAKREAGAVVSVNEVEALFSQLGAEMRSRLLAWRGQLVAELHGASEARIHQVLTERVHELLESITTNSPNLKP